MTFKKLSVLIDEFSTFDIKVLFENVQRNTSAVAKLPSQIIKTCTQFLLLLSSIAS